LVGVLLATALGALALAIPAAADWQAIHAGCPAGSQPAVYVGQTKCVTLAARKRIYWELVHYQDTHPGQDEHAYVVIAKRWRISLEAVQRIAVDGSVKMWPLPPSP
jgi:hypothetical protein